MQGKALENALVSETNSVKKIEFAKACVNKSLFQKRLFSLIKAIFFGLDGNKTVWRKSNTFLQIKKLKQNVKHGDGHIMIQGCMSFNGVDEMALIEGNMNNKQYIYILRNNLCNRALKLKSPNPYYLQQDNDSKQKGTARLRLLHNVKKISTANTSRIPRS